MCSRASLIRPVFIGLPEPGHNGVAVSKRFCFTTRSVIGLENSSDFLNQSDKKRLGHFRFPALDAVYLYLLWVLIGSLEYFHLLWLVVVITLVLFLRHSIEKRSKWLIELSRAKRLGRKFYCTSWLKKKTLYLDITPPMLHFSKVDSIRTIIKIVRRYPLVSVLSSLSCNSCHLHWSSQVDLQPLVMVLVPRGPGPYKPTSFRTVESR